eukprot:747951-Hanusia_phi.AAC.3
MNSLSQPPSRALILTSSSRLFQSNLVLHLLALHTPVQGSLRVSYWQAPRRPVRYHPHLSESCLLTSPESPRASRVRIPKFTVPGPYFRLNAMLDPISSVQVPLLPLHPLTVGGGLYYMSSVERENKKTANINSYWRHMIFHCPYTDVC